MAFKPIEGLMFNGVQVGYDDGAVIIPVPTPTPTPVPKQIGFPIQFVNLQDAMYLYKMTGPYSSVLRNILGSHQLHYDILTNGGKTYWQMTGPAQDAMQLSISRIINLAGSDNSGALRDFNVGAYNGPLKAIYTNLVDYKLGR